jgi:glycosyltransferase involved in cell wall biosynthesis
MLLHDCSHRRVITDDAVGAPYVVCRLAEQILGLPTDAHCRVDELVCRSCGRHAPPTAAAPNAVVASIVYDHAVTICGNESSPDDHAGKAFQAQRYVFPALAEGDDRKGTISDSLAADFSYGRRAIAETGSHARVGRETPRSGASRFVDRIFARSGRRRARVGLVGFNTASGLGYMARDLAVHIADRWLVVEHWRFPAIDLPATACRVDFAPSSASDRVLLKWLRGVEWVICSEVSYFESLPRLAREAGTRLALIPMWESMSPFLKWLRFVDLLICPTRHSADMFLQWKTRFGFTWDVRCLPWPIATDRFRFRQRQKCERFLFINGTGGVGARRLDGTALGVRRKGLDVVFAAARLAPEVPWIVYSQTDDLPPCPANIDVRLPPQNNADLYDEGDVCVQPSRWEGLGLQLLECQAAGLPLVTTDAAPMNEHQPLRLLDPKTWEWGFVHDGQPARLPVFDPASVARVVRELFGTDLTDSSRAARDFVERCHSWDGAATALRRIFDSRTGERVD